MKSTQITPIIESTHSDLWTRKHTLQIGDKVLGILVLPHKISQNTAIASTENATWHFRKKGFFKPEILIMEGAEQIEIGRMKLRGNLTKGTGQIRGLPAFTWRQTRIWNYRYEMRDAQGQVICIFHHRIKAFRAILEIEIPEEAMESESLSLLLLLGWFIMVLQQARGRFRKNMP